MRVDVRRVLATDGPLLREIRLEALADTPIAYLDTLERARTLTEADWTTWALRGSVEGESHQVLALAGGRPVGTMAVFREDAVAWLVAVYVAPSERGTGLLARLLAPCAQWALRGGAVGLRLEVHEDNARAIAAYARLGFVPTGERRPYPLDPERSELVMELGLA